MRSDFMPSFFVCLLLLLVGEASAEEPRAILDRAIQAHGGAARLELTKKGHLKATIEEHRFNNAIKLQIEEWFDLPNRYSRTIDRTSDDPPTHLQEIYTGKERWIREGTQPPRLDRQPPPGLQEWYAILALLLSLRDKDVQLKSIPNETTDDRVLVGFHITFSKVMGGDFFFDKSSGLLSRTRQLVKNFVIPQEVKMEKFYEDYREIQGIHYPMRFRSVAGQEYSNIVTLSSIEFGNRFDEGVFTMPQTPAMERPTGGEEQSPGSRDNKLIIATVGAGVVVGAVWFIVRASKRGKREKPPG